MPTLARRSNLCLAKMKCLGIPFLEETRKFVFDGNRQFSVIKTWVQGPELPVLYDPNGGFLVRCKTELPSTSYLCMLYRLPSQIHDGSENIVWSHWVFHMNLSYLVNLAYTPSTTMKTDCTIRINLNLLIRNFTYKLQTTANILIPHELLHSCLTPLP